MLLDGMRSNAAQSWGVKLAFGLIIIVFVFWGIGSVQAPTNTVASVNGSKITMREFQRSYSRMAQEIQRVIPGVTEEQLASFQLEANVLQQLIFTKLLEDASEETGIDVSTFALRNAIVSLPYFKNDKGEFDKTIYEEMLKQSGQSAAEFERALRQDLLPEDFTKLLTSGLYISDASARDQYNFVMEKRSMEYVLFPYDTAAQVVTDEEIEDAYNKSKALYALPARIQLEYINFNPDKLADPSSVTDADLEGAYSARQTQFAVPEQVKASHILFKVEQSASEEEAKAVLTSIQAIEARIRAGEKFADLAKEFGQDGTKEEGGDLGWFAKNQMVPAFADAAFSLATGELSQPVRTNFGYHLILVEDKKDAKIRTFDEVKAELRNALALEKVNTSLQDIVDASLLELANNKSLDEVAKLYKLAAEKTELLDAHTLAEKLGLRPSDVEILMSVEKGTLWDTPISLAGGLAIVRVVDSQIATAQPLAEVSDLIKEELSLEKAKVTTFEEAKEMTLTFSEKTPQNIKTSALFTRNGEIKELTTNMLLAKEIFASDDKDWKKTPFVIENGVIIVRLAKIEPANQKGFDAVKQVLLSEMKSAKSNMMFQQYVAMLRAEADIDILMPELFEQKVSE